MEGPYLLVFFVVPVTRTVRATVGTSFPVSSPPFPRTLTDQTPVVPRDTGRDEVHRRRRGPARPLDTGTGTPGGRTRGRPPPEKVDVVEGHSRSGVPPPRLTPGCGSGRRPGRQTGLKCEPEVSGTGDWRVRETGHWTRSNSDHGGRAGRAGSPTKSLGGPAGLRQCGGGAPSAGPPSGPAPTALSTVGRDGGGPWYR